MKRNWFRCTIGLDTLCGKGPWTTTQAKIAGAAARLEATQVAQLAKVAETSLGATEVPALVTITDQAVSVTAIQAATGATVD